MTKTPLEIENMQKTDDPDVFQFSISDVSYIFSFLGMSQRTKYSPQSDS